MSVIENSNKKVQGLVRIPTGIPGLDEMIEGGFPFPSVILVSGTAGTGKTTFGLKFLCKGAELGERGLYITTLSEPTQWMLRFASQFDFVRPEYFGEEIIYMDLGSTLRKMDGDQILDTIENKIAEFIPQRIVIDPVTVVGSMIKSDYRTFLFDMTNMLKNWSVTTVVTGEVNPNELYPAEIAYAVDGIILLMLSEEAGTRRKYLEVLKMRGTNHLTGRQSIDITRSDGIVVLKARF
ncbi:MAG: ATPase domain-containing protein [Methanomassiliicoccales archaeon]|jgi:circadian clock protein KaiC|nr:ATPase domain-containing protein [Methanomassiliicoccales archaeon]